MLLNELRLVHHPCRTWLVQSVEQVLELLALRDEVLEALEEKLASLLLLAQDGRVTSRIFLRASLRQLILEDGELLLKLIGKLDQVTELGPELDDLPVLVEDASRLVANQHGAKLPHDKLTALELVALRAQATLLRPARIEATSDRHVVQLAVRSFDA